MSKVMMNMDELEQVTGGSPCDWQCPADPIIDGVLYVGSKAVDGARWVWNGIKSLF